MISKQSYSFIFSTLYVLIFLFLITQNNSTLLLSIYSAVLIVSVNKLWKSLHTSRNRMLFVFCYFALLTFQITQHSNTAHQFASVPLFLLSNKVLLTLIVLSLFIYFYLFNIQDNFYPAYKNPYVVANATVKLLHKKADIIWLYLRKTEKK